MSTTFHTPIDNCSSVVTVARLANSGSTITVASASAFGSPTTDAPLRVSIHRNGVPITIYEITSISGNVLTFSQNLDGTSDQNLLIGDQVLVNLCAGTILELQTAINSGGGGSGSGTVTSVALTLPNILSVSGSPITSSGTLAVSLANENANVVFAGPGSGSATTPSFRALVAADIPNIAESQVTNLTTDLSALAPLSSPALTGTPTAPTATSSTNTTQIATTAFVKAQGYSTTTGTVTSVGLSVPTILSVSGSPITSSGTLAVSLANENANVVFAGPGSGSATTPSFRALVAADIPNIAESQVTNLTSDLAAKAPLTSPALTGTPTAPTPSTADSSTKIATTAYVQAQDYLTGNQTVTLTGNVTGSGSTSISTTIASGAVTNAMLAGSIAASKLVETDITLAESQVTNLTTDLARKAIPFTFGGTGTPTVAEDVCPWLFIPSSLTCVEFAISVLTAPSGGDLTISILESTNSGSSFGTTIVSLSLTSGNRLVSTTSFTTSALTSGGYLRCDIGAVNGAANWTARLIAN